MLKWYTSCHPTLPAWKNRPDRATGRVRIEIVTQTKKQNLTQPENYK
jgi:hypothetical protein